ncbi:unnamed protein product [Rhizoctonia solani]|uniref:HIT-type domain-containing protein n=1 Tax=Rhizoctonia solani TaxID=456999 RepID=A0A8H3BVY2_9AGAM|nr:unnamed protein product [Rhizoctonia solani]
MPRIFDLKTRVEQVQPGSNNPCGICQRQFAKYTCPACNLQYCSLVCYRAEAHSACTETFYKSALAEEIQSQPAKSTEEKRQMLELLKRFEEESLEEAEDSDDEDGLASRLEGIDLDKVDHDTLWGLLSEEERQKFTRMLMDPTSEDSQKLFNTSKLLEGHEGPWWTLEDPSPDVLPRINQVPSNMLAGKFNHLLLFNIFHLSLTYAYTIRTFVISPLSAQPSDELEEIRGFILPLSPFLRDKKSTIMFTSVDGAITDWASRLPELPRPKLLRTLTEDTKRIFSARPVVVAEGDADPQQSNHDRCMRFLSDMHALFDGLKKHAHVAHKLMFYLAFVANLPSSASKELLAAVEAWQEKHPEDERDTSPINISRSQALIEEI